MIVSLLAFVYYRYKQLSGLQCVLASLRPAVVALIASAGLSMLQLVAFGDEAIQLANVDWVGLALFLAAFVVLRWKKCNPIPVMAACGVIQLGLGLIFPGI